MIEYERAGHCPARPFAHNFLPHLLDNLSAAAGQLSSRGRLSRASD